MSIVIDFRNHDPAPDTAALVKVEGWSCAVPHTHSGCGKDEEGALTILKCCALASRIYVCDPLASVQVIEKRMEMVEAALMVVVDESRE